MAHYIPPKLEDIGLEAWTDNPKWKARHNSKGYDELISAFKQQILANGRVNKAKVMKDFNIKSYKGLDTLFIQYMKELG